MRLAHGCVSVVGVTDPSLDRLLDPARVFGDVEKWMEITGTKAPEIQPGSALDEDAQVSPNYQVAHTAWGSWMSAVDNLDALRQLLSQVVHPYAPYSLLRVAIENAALAVWLLHPDDSNERLTPRLRLAWDEVHDVEPLWRIAPGSVAGRRTPEERRDEIKALATSAGLDVSRVCGRWSWASVVREAGGSTWLRADMVELKWRLCSGFSHSRDWARLSWLETEKLGEPVDGVVTLRTTTDIRQVMTITVTAHALLREGKRLFDYRKLAFRTH